MLPIAAFSQTVAPSPVIMDDPAAEQRLNREIWESVRGTEKPYSDVLQYVKKAQESGGKAATTVKLPTGWKIAPAGAQTTVGTLPFDAAAFGGTVLVVNSGWAGSTQSVSAVNPATVSVTRTVSIPTVFPSVATGPGEAFYVSGGNDKKVYRYDSNYALNATYPLPGAATGIGQFDNTLLAVTYSEAPSGAGLLRAAHAALIDTTTGIVTRDVRLSDYEAYAIMAGGADKLYVTIPGTNQVAVLDKDLNILKTIATGRTPQTMCQFDNLQYVVNTDSDSITVIDTATDLVTGTFSTAFASQTYGAAPSSCAADSARLYVTLTQANAVAVLNRSTGALQGYIPTGWYPTKVLLVGSNLIVVSAKGIQPLRPNPNGEYILSLLKGTTGVIAKADIDANLAAWTAQVQAGSPLLAPASVQANPIRHIFYLVKENRTYDQVLGDLGQGNGDPSLTVFGRNVTPIQHYLAEEFVNLDNFFVDGEVSTTGHTFTSAGYASPYSQMLTSLEYSGRFNGSANLVPAAFSPVNLWDAANAKNVRYRVYGELIYLQGLWPILINNVGVQSELAKKVHAKFTSGQKTSQLFAPLATLLARHARQSKERDGIRNLLRNAGFGKEFSRFFTGDDSLYYAMLSNERLIGDLIGWLSKWQFDYRPFDMGYSDLDRVASWMDDFRAKDAAGTVESLHILTVPNDHTSGENPGGLSPAQFVAQNDAAIDLIMRTLAASRIWQNSLVLIVEDDAQDGPDHVDGTRTIAFAAGPRVKRNALVSDYYDQVSMVRTIGVLLGLGTLSMNDALAVPMTNIFLTSAANTTYNPPPVSTALVPVDKARYDQLRATLPAIR